MSFDFFNTSHLAFGSKLTQVFAELEKQFMFAEDNIGKLREYLDIVDLYNGRNYRTPLPTEPTSPVRTNELFDIFNDKTCIIKELYYSSAQGKVHADFLLYDKVNNLFTKTSGETTIKTGYCYTKRAISNNYPTQTLSFTSSKDNTKGTLLFQYRVDRNGYLNLKNINSLMMISSSDDQEFKTLRKGSNVSFPYTATDYECICVMGQDNNLNVSLNGKVIARGQGIASRRHVILYLKPGDKVAGSGISWGFRIEYGK